MPGLDFPPAVATTPVTTRSMTTSPGSCHRSTRGSGLYFRRLVRGGLPVGAHPTLSRLGARPPRRNKQHIGRSTIAAITAGRDDLPHLGELRGSSALLISWPGSALHPHHVEATRERPSSASNVVRIRSASAATIRRTWLAAPAPPPSPSRAARPSLLTPLAGATGTAVTRPPLVGHAGPGAQAIPTTSHGVPTILMPRYDTPTRRHRLRPLMLHCPRRGSPRRDFRAAEPS